MSFYDDASIVLIPSGYKASKLYCAKPTDGSGDLTFTRTGSTATRVNESGLIEKCRTNQLTHSEDFTGSRGWSVFGGTVTATANYGVSPTGTNTSTRLVFAGADTIWLKSVSGLTGFGLFSLYIKGTAGQTLQITFAGTDKLITLGTGWNRFATNGNIASGTQVFINTYGGATARDIQVWGGQVETGDIATDYIPTTSAAVTVGPIANVPRLDYTGGGCPKLLMEPTRTNLTTYSNQFDNTVWTKEGITITANATTSPDGYTNADKIVASAIAGDKVTYQISSVTVGAIYTASAYFKASEYNYAFIRLGGIANNPYIIYDLINQNIVSTALLTSSSITSMGNGWYKITATGTTTANVLAPNLMVIPSSGYILGGDNIPEFTGNGISGGFIWGCQLEAGAYATSYIPTFNASVTRNADIAIKNSISSLIGQTEGSVLCNFITESDTSSDVTTVFGLHSGTSITNRIQLYSINGTLGLLIVANNIVRLNEIIYDNAPKESVKVAFKYSSNGVTVYVNGTQRFTTSTSVVFTQTMDSIAICSRSGIDDFGKGQLVSQLLHFKIALSNADLATLTTL